MFGLGKLFGGKDKEAEAVAPAAPERPAASAFVRREAVFDRERKPAGHIFRLQHADAGFGDGIEAIAPERRLALDARLLDSLAASAREEGWGGTLAFVPLGLEALDHPGLAFLPARNTVLLLRLAPDSTAPDDLPGRLAALKARGFRLGVFRQPKHQAFAAVLREADFAAIDVAASQGGNVRDFSIAVRSPDVGHPLELLALHVETRDDFELCRQWHYALFHGPFAARRNPDEAETGHGDPHKLNLLHLLNLVQGDAETAEVAVALKQDPVLTFRILRYLNSAGIGLSRPVSSIDQALLLLGRQRLARWLSVLLFSVKEPDFTDWLLVESALGRGRIMELLGTQRFPAAEGDHLFLTGVFSRLDRLLRLPLDEAVAAMPLPTNVRNALLGRNGPYAPLLAVAEACEEYDPVRMAETARTAGLTTEEVNRALLEATAWTSEITGSWD